MTCDGIIVAIIYTQLCIVFGGRSRSLVLEVYFENFVAMGVEKVKLTRRKLFPSKNLQMVPLLMLLLN